MALSLLYSTALLSPQETHLLPLMGFSLFFLVHRPSAASLGLGCVPRAAGLHPSQLPHEALVFGHRCHSGNVFKAKLPRFSFFF